MSGDERTIYDEGRCPGCVWESARDIIAKAERQYRKGNCRSNNPGARVKARKILDRPKPAHTYDRVCNAIRPRNKCKGCANLLEWGEREERVTCPKCGIEQTWLLAYFWPSNPRKMYDRKLCLFTDAELEAGKHYKV